MTSSYSPERRHMLLARLVRPFKSPLLEQSLALSRIVRPAASAALESQPRPQPDQADPCEPRHEATNPRAQPAPTEPAHDMAVRDEPGQQHDLEDGDHQDEPDSGVSREGELRHHCDEECARLRVEQVAEKALAPGASVAQSGTAGNRRRSIIRRPPEKTSHAEIAKVGRARELEDRERGRRTFEED